MRAGALSDPETAAILNAQFVCAWEKKGAVESYRVKGAPEKDFKEGGNILSYICTPRGEVLHAIPGSWPPKAFRENLDWARHLDRKLMSLTPGQAVDRAREAHRERAWNSQAHTLLSTHVLKPVAHIEKTFFETLLQEPYAPEKDIIIREIDESDLQQLLKNLPDSGG